MIASNQSIEGRGDDEKEVPPWPGAPLAIFRLLEDKGAGCRIAGKAFRGLLHAGRMADHGELPFFKLVNRESPFRQVTGLRTISDHSSEPFRVCFRVEKEIPFIPFVLVASLELLVWIFAR